MAVSFGGKRIIGAIDFGTSHTGLAYSIFDKEPTQIYAKDDWGDAPTAVESKVPSSILFTNQNEVVAYGYEAENKFRTMGAHQMEKHYFLKGFKMTLHSLKKFNHNINLITHDGKSKPAKFIFAKALNYLGQCLCEFIKQKRGRKPSLQELSWVITVPAIWEESARQFMKEAAYNGGLCSNKSQNTLQIALEPECAALFVRERNPNQASYYAVVDCGGGTVDIAYHHCITQGTSFRIEELLKPSGKPYGGTIVDKAFTGFMDEIIRPGFMEWLYKKHPDVWLKLMESFERKKSRILPNCEPQYFDVSFDFAEACMEYTGMGIKEAIAKSRTSDVTFEKAAIKIDYKKLGKFFAQPVKWICMHLESQLKLRDLHKVDTLYVVGGFAQCKILQENIRLSIAEQNHLVNAENIIYPPEAQLAIVKGAILYGTNPNVVQLRRARYTYGTDVAIPFDRSNPDHVKRKAIYDGEVKCKNAFSTFITAGENVKTSDPPREFSYSPVYDNQTSMSIHIYRSPHQRVEYIDEGECIKVGGMTLTMTDTRGGKDRKAIVKVKFFGTEIHATAVDPRNNRSVDCKVDFLSD